MFMLKALGSRVTGEEDTPVGVMPILGMTPKFVQARKPKSVQ
jgi:hypothetical protein